MTKAKKMTYVAETPTVAARHPFTRGMTREENRVTRVEIVEEVADDSFISWWTYFDVFLATLRGRQMCQRILHFI